MVAPGFAASPSALLVAVILLKIAEVIVLVLGEVPIVAVLVGEGRGAPICMYCKDTQSRRRLVISWLGFPNNTYLY